MAIGFIQVHYGWVHKHAKSNIKIQFTKNQNSKAMVFKDKSLHKMKSQRISFGGFLAINDYEMVGFKDKVPSNNDDVNWLMSWNKIMSKYISIKGMPMVTCWSHSTLFFPLQLQKFFTLSLCDNHENDEPRYDVCFLDNKCCQCSLCPGRSQ